MLRPVRRVAELGSLGGTTRMAYFLHITRRKFWATEGTEITADEWRAYFRSDPEFKVPGAGGPSYADWHCPADGVIRSLWLLEGDVSALHPDRLFVDKMFAIARRLGARVQGDEGEIYRLRSEVTYAADSPVTIQPPSRWPWWRRWFRGGILTPKFYEWSRAS